MNEHQKRICKAEVKPNCYLIFSASRIPVDDRPEEFRIRPHISFFYDAGDYAAEWEPEHGPIQVWQKCQEDSENAKEHYFYDFVYDNPLNWSQLAVDNNQLPYAANTGNFDHIFDVLKDWANK